MASGDSQLGITMYWCWVTAGLWCRVTVGNWCQLTVRLFGVKVKQRSWALVLGHGCGVGSQLRFVFGLPHSCALVVSHSWAFVRGRDLALVLSYGLLGSQVDEL